MVYYVTHQLLSGRTVCVGPFAGRADAERRAAATSADYARIGQHNPLALEHAKTVAVVTKRDRRWLWYRR